MRRFHDPLLDMYPCIRRCFVVHTWSMNTWSVRHLSDNDVPLLKVDFRRSFLLPEVQV